MLRLGVVAGLLLRDPTGALFPGSNGSERSNSHRLPWGSAATFLLGACVLGTNGEALLDSAASELTHPPLLSLSYVCMRMRAGVCRVCSIPHIIYLFGTIAAGWAGCSRLTRSWQRAASHCQSDSGAGIDAARPGHRNLDDAGAYNWAFTYLI